jgi:hypothetical protein
MSSYMLPFKSFFMLFFMPMVNSHTHNKASTISRTPEIARKRKRLSTIRSSRFSLSHSGFMLPLPPLGLAEFAKRADALMKGDLLGWRDQWFFWAKVSTTAVVAGLFGELPELIHELIAMWSKYKVAGNTISLNEPKEADWIKPVAFVGWILIVVGVVGELGTTIMLGRADAALETF